MPSKRTGDWRRPILIHCCRDGTISYRQRGEPIFNNVALPVFSVDTLDQANEIQVRFCRAQYDPHPLMPEKTWYVLNDFSGKAEDLPRVTEMFRAYWRDIMKQPV